MKVEYPCSVHLYHMTLECCQVEEDEILTFTRFWELKWWKKPQGILQQNFTMWIIYFAIKDTIGSCIFLSNPVYMIKYITYRNNECSNPCRIFNHTSLNPLLSPSNRIAFEVLNLSFEFNTFYSYLMDLSSLPHCLGSRR